MAEKNLTRRELLALGALTLAGCSSQQQEPEPEEQPAAEPEPESEPSPEPEPTGAGSPSGTLVLYFSRADENYNVGVISEGNTAVIAKMIASRTGADLFELVPVEPYPEGYQECCDVALDEKNRGARPELAALPDLAPYSTIFFGFPCWWGDLPMPVYTAIEALDWNGKTICPFNTHEGSGEAGMFSTLEAVCDGATVTAGLTVRGQDAQNDREGTQAEVDSWLSELGM
ncbi:MAG: hypothetical protein IJG82_00180 [Atopobiaceae bacterium]|nr:hypothetical protein [Atopobiaceae bacterium]